MAAEQGTGKTVPCPACTAANEPGAPRCTACGILIGRRRRRGVAENSDTPFSPAATVHNRPALRAYHLAIVSIVPGVGLFAGPVACVLGLTARSRGKRDPLFTATGPVFAAIILGALTALSNWVGFVMMYLGLRNAGWF